MHQIKLFNTDGRKKEVFKPLKEGEVTLYSCGPTVYHYAHIGNLRAYVFADTLHRMLKANGFEVKHVINITDVGHLTGDNDDGEDKMLAGARREKKTVYEIAEHYTQTFLEDFSALHCTVPMKWTKATEHIQDMITMIQDLEQEGYTYISDGNVYFDTEKLPDYGRLFGGVSDNEDKSRVDADASKKNQRDFALWFTKSKFDDQEMKWDSPWGVGYPGWHIECSAMASKYLGKQIDIHTGGIDHIHIHHTNEIAQSECAFGQCGSDHKWVNTWMHNEFLVIDDGKMSKSSGEFLRLKTLTDDGFTAEDYRYFLLLASYRKSINFSYDALTQAKQAVSKLQQKIQTLVNDDNHNAPLSDVEKRQLEHYKNAMLVAISDDLNTSTVIATLWEALDNEKLPGSVKHNVALYADSLLGLGFENIKPVSIPSDVMELVRMREEARAAKDWAKADELRDNIAVLGYVVSDGASGAEVSVKRD